MYNNYNEFEVNLSKIHRGRKNGVSGMMRVKNDAEFIDAAIESCIDALDELVIVYNDCSDNSPEIIKSLAQKYPSKIRYYEYKPKILSHNLSEIDYQSYLDGRINPLNTLANYYNYALSKTTYKYVMKIDADQIYFSEKLNYTLNLYRKKQKKTITILDICRFVSIFLGLRSKKNKKISYSIRNYNSYINTVEFLAAKFKIPLSLSGINIFLINEEQYIPLGVSSSSYTLLPPFNGVGDHLIFTVKRDTYFKIYDCPEYNSLINTKHTIIEKLIGCRFHLKYGFMWYHLNLNRNSCKDQIKEIFYKHNNWFIKMESLRAHSFVDIMNQIPSSIMSEPQKKFFQFIHKYQILKIPQLKSKF